MYITVNADIKEAMNVLEGFDKERPAIKKHLLGMSGQKTRSKVKKAYNSYLHKRSGNLYKSIHYYLYRNNKAAVVTVHNKTDKVRYGYMLTHSYDVVPKNGKVLTFQINGAWKRSHGFHINGKNYVEEPAERYLNSQEYRSDLDKKTQKEIDRIEKKYAKKGLSK